MTLRLPRITKLRLPPRRVPFGLWCQAVLDPAAMLWAGGLACSLLYILFFSGDGLPWEAARLRLLGVQAPARIESVEATMVTLAGETLARVTYSFQTPAGIQRRLTHDLSSHWSAGSPATALYLPADPAVSRLRGEKRGHPGVLGSGLFLFPLAALLFGIPVWRRTLLAALLLREGLAAEGHIVSGQRLRRGLRGYDVYRYVYEFESLWGEIFEGAAITNLDLPWRGEEPAPGVVTRFPPDSAPKRSVLYLPRDADVSTLIDALPLRYRLSVDRQGEWVAGPSWPAIVVVGGIVVLLIAAVVCVWLAVAGLLPDLGR